MKRIKYLITTLLIMIFAMTSFGCYMISGQKMSSVKGTYKLTSYTYTPSYEKRSDYEVVDTNGEKKLFSAKDKALDFAITQEYMYVKTGEWYGSVWDMDIEIDEKTESPINGVYYIYKKSGMPKEEVVYFTEERLMEVITEYAEKNVTFYNYTPKTYNYITDENYLYEDYLIVTGSGRGCYVHKDVNNSAYGKEVNLSYIYNSEDSSKVEYVIWNDALSGNSDSGGHKLGVAKDRLNFSLPAFDYTQLFTKKKMRSDDIYVSWEKVDRATDLSYVKKKLGELKEYSYENYGVRGIYEWDTSIVVETNEVVDFDYQYYFIVIDTANGVTTAKISYALRETPTVRVDKTVAFTHSWSALTIDGLTWTFLKGGYDCFTIVDGVQRQMHNRSNDISDARLEELISYKLPTIQE